MHKLQRPAAKPSKPQWHRGDPWPLRAATAAELEEDKRRHVAAKDATSLLAPPPAPEPSGNLCACLVAFAAWRRCVCGSVVLYVNSQAGTAGTFLCGRCERRREALARECRPAISLPARVALHLWALWSTVNDNGSEARS